jgi:RimJ/RimL family protein N-acetyltransferase
LKQPHLETKRCVLRPAEPGDLDALVAAVLSPLFPRRLPLSQMRSSEELSRWLDQMCSRSANGSAFLWSIDLKEGPRCIGQISLSSNRSSNAWGIAFWLDPTHWGHGLAVETVSSVITCAFESLAITELWAGVALWNHRSIVTLKHLGLHFLTDNPAGYLVSGVPEPVHEYHLTRQQWQSQRCNA